MGFPVGAQQQMVLRALRRHPYVPHPCPDGASISSGTQRAVPVAAAASLQQQPTLFRLNSGGDRHVPIGNGGIGPGYYWTQTLSELTVGTPPPPHLSSHSCPCSCIYLFAAGLR